MYKLNYVYMNEKYSKHGVFLEIKNKGIVKLCDFDYKEFLNQLYKVQCHKYLKFIDYGFYNDYCLVLFLELSNIEIVKQNLLNDAYCINK